MFLLVKAPGIPKMGTWDMIRAGLLGAAWKFGLASTRRLFTTSDYFVPKAGDARGWMKVSR